ncbi:hypothetical protein C2E23DRAFT_11957 [Lenzites betulinus]|nr:hypothetical protein C2E23DRAFT_11957 [Lenzites betulinus]
MNSEQTVEGRTFYRKAHHDDHSRLHDESMDVRKSLVGRRKSVVGRPYLQDLRCGGIDYPTRLAGLPGGDRKARLSTESAPHIRSLLRCHSSPPPGVPFYEVFSHFSESQGGKGKPILARMSSRWSGFPFSYVPACTPSS